MRILWQNQHYPDVAKGGGGAINTYYITTSMQRLGHKVVILARGEREAFAPLGECKRYHSTKIGSAQLARKIVAALATARTLLC